MLVRFKHRPMEVCWVAEMWQRFTASNLAFNEISWKDFMDVTEQHMLYFIKVRNTLSCCYDYPTARIHFKP